MTTNAPLPLAPIAVADLAALFGAFGDPTRLRILNVLAAGELAVGEIVELLDLPQPTISRHLATLRRAGVVEVAWEWRHGWYRLAPPGDQVHRALLECVTSRFLGIPSLDEERLAAAERVQSGEANAP